MKNIKLYVFPISFIILIGALLYANTLDNVFVLDDFITIKENEAIRSLSNITYFLKNYLHRSIFYISLSLNYYLCKLDPTGYHFVNVIIHIRNAILLYLFLLSICKYRLFLSHIFYCAFIPSLLFLIHPIQANTINHITTRSIMLCTLFYLLSLLLYIYGRECKKVILKYILYWSSFISFLLCIGSKSVGITLPIMILMVNKYFYSKENTSRFKWNKVDIFLFGICILFIISLFLFGDVWQADYHGMIHNVLTQAEVIIRYIALMFIPIHIVPEYDIPIKKSIELPILFSIVFIIVLLYFSIKNYHKRNLLSFSIFWFFITIAPSSSIIPRAITMLLYRTYLPIIGFCIFCGVSMRNIIRYIHQKGVYFIIYSMYFVIVLLACGLTMYQNNLYNSNIILWKAVKEKFPNNAVPYFNIGTFLMRENRIDEAIDNFKKALERNNLFAKAHFHLGIAYQLKGMIDLAIMEYEEALRIRPYSDLMDVNYGIYINLGNAYFEKKDFINAIRWYSQYMSEYKETPHVLNNLYHVYKQMGDYSKALYSINRAIELDKRSFVYQLNKADLFFEMNELYKAENAYKEILIQDSHNIGALFKLGVLYHQTNQPEQALEMYHKILSINKLHMGALNNSGVILYQKGEVEQARVLWEKILAIEPHHKGALENLQRIHQ